MPSNPRLTSLGCELPASGDVITNQLVFGDIELLADITVGQVEGGEVRDHRPTDAAPNLERGDLVLSPVA